MRWASIADMCDILHLCPCPYMLQCSPSFPPPCLAINLLPFPALPCRRDRSCLRQRLRRTGPAAAGRRRGEPPAGGTSAAPRSCLCAVQPVGYRAQAAGRAAGRGAGPLQVGWALLPLGFASWLSWMQLLGSSSVLPCGPALCYIGRQQLGSIYCLPACLRFFLPRVFLPAGLWPQCCWWRCPPCWWHTCRG
jgi:hypothetical protein